MSESKTKRPTFAVAGIGFIFDKHKAAIESVDGEIVAVCDSDREKFSKVMDCTPFVNYDDMLNMVNKLEVDYVVICTPNYLHVPMIAKALHKTKAQIICEKPVVLNDRDISIIRNPRVNCIMQLRYLDVPKIKGGENRGYLDIFINRGEWYFEGWKGDERKSGGLLFNIGVHYFDLLSRVFGQMGSCRTVYRDQRYAFGIINFAKGEVVWSIDLTAPKDNQRRIIKINDEEINLTSGIDELHKKVYSEIVKGRGIKADLIYDVTHLIGMLSRKD